MTDHPKPSAAALSVADAICKQHGMLPGGYMRDSLAEALEVFAAVRRQRDMALVCQGCQQGWPLVDIEGDLMHDLPRELIAPHDYGTGTRTACEAAAIRQDDGRSLVPIPPDPPVGTMLGVPITAAERDAISKDGP